MIDYPELSRLIQFIFDAHQNHNLTPQVYRQGGKIPYAVHPMWCAMMLLADRRIPLEERKLGCEVLLLHGVLEDTDVELPDYVDERTKELVEKMSYEDWEKYQKRVTEEEPFLKLLLLLDKVESMYEDSVSEWKRKDWKKLAQQLAEDTEEHYGDLRVVQVAKEIIDNTDW